VSASHEKRQREAYTRDAQRKLALMERHNRTYARKASLAARAIEASCGKAPRILEMGCGGGFFTRELALRMPSASIVATDVFEPMLDACRARIGDLANVSVRHFDGAAANDVPLFDAICAVDVIHHLSDPIEALRGWLRYARRGGSLVVLESNPAHPLLALLALPKPEERRFFLNNRASLRRWTEAAGWSDVRVERLPLYLPGGPTRIWRRLDQIEELLHRGQRLWGFLSGSFLIRATA
jgi:SAM-dependent methyltransferase